MVFVRKFSEFPAGTLDEGVGLAGGANTRGPSGTGGGGTTSHTFPQQIPAVAKGDWVRIADGSGLYVQAQGDTAEHGEVIGLCTLSDATSFTVVQAGYIESGLAIPGISGLLPGNIYFIDTANPGVMVLADATINGQISRPLFDADSADSGWVLPYRPMIVGGAAPSSGGGGSGTDSNIKSIFQAGHPFIPGDVLRVDTVAVGGPVQYALAQANTFDNSQAVGVVCLTPAPTANTFSLQECGYNIGSITTDYLGVAVVAKTIYYLSPTVAGKVTSINPTAPGQFSRPVYSCEQGVATAGVNAGWILPQRPLTSAVANPTASPYVYLGRLDNASPDGPFADANIFNNNGGPFKSYFINYNPNVVNGHGLSAVGPNPITIGFQFAAGGVFYTGTVYQASLSGVNNSAGLGVATLWGYIEDTSSPANSAIFFPHLGTETGTRVAVSFCNFQLTDNAVGGGMQLIGNAYCTDWSVGNVPSNHNFTSFGQAAGSNGGGPGVFTSGIRLFFGGAGAAIFDGTSGYFSIWGIPNS